MLDARTCSNCGSPLPARAPEGLCPRCLLRAGLGSDALSVGRSGEVSATLGLEGGVLETIAAALGAVPRVLLRDTDAGFEPPLIRPGRGDGTDASTRYRIDGEIARGGMGSVLKGRDPDLGRDVAIKVLREDLRDNADMVRRFVEEAQIGGQLQHPGIVPIYELGTFADCRPFFSMKLVKGQTLTALLEARTGPGTELPRFLDVVAAVAQTVAYAHARGVIHRDLKPSNVMVGSFGEVQVMDWGLAKVLPRGGVADDAAAGKTDRHETVIATARSGAADSDLSHAGSAMGTPSYMAPEQARGEIERVDERADVFALGSILCEVLTGKPAFVGRSSGEIQRKAALGDLGEAFGRLDAAGADGVLVGLAKEWLATEPEDRPRDAGVVAERLRAYLASIQERMRQAELAQAAASARAEEAKQTAAAAEARAGAERRARWLTVGLAAAVLALAALGGGGYSWMQQQRAGRLAATARAVNDALDQAVRHQGEARAAGDDLAKWAVALAQVDRADDLVKANEADPLLRGRVAAVRAEIERGRADVEEHARRVLADQKLLDTLEAIRGGFGGPDDTKRTVASYRSAFLAAGLDLVATEPKLAGQWIAARTAPIELATHLDNWAIVHRLSNDPESTWQRLIAAARAADPDPWRDALRAKCFSRDAADLEAFRRLADDTKALDTQPTTSLVLLAQQFKYGFGDSARAEQVLRHAWHRDAGDFWVNFNLALVRGTGASDPAEVYPDTVEAIRFLSAAVAARPRSSIAHTELGRVLGARGRLDEAIAEHRTAQRLQPDSVWPHVCLGQALQAQGKLDEAIAEFREALRLIPDDPWIHRTFEQALNAQVKPDALIVGYRETLRLNPDDFAAHSGLGNALRAQGKLDEAIAEYGAALRLKPDFAAVHHNLGIALRARGDLDGAIAAFREEFRISPASADAPLELIEVLKLKNVPDRGIALFDDLIREQRQQPYFVFARARYLVDLGRRDQAEADLAKAGEHWPDNPSGWKERGRLYALMGRLDEAATDFGRALALVARPKDPWSNDDPAWSNDDPAGVYPDSVFDAGVFERLVRLRPSDQTLLIARVRHHARRREWREAAGVAARLGAMEPLYHFSWHNEVALRSYIGDAEGSRRLCQRMMERFGSTPDPTTARRTVLCCLLEPDAFPNLGALAPLVQRFLGSPTANHNPWSMLAAGLHDYRLGRFSAAIERLRPITDETGPRTTAEVQMAQGCVVRALAHQKSSQEDEARRLLAAAEVLAQQASFDPEREGPLPMSWSDWLRYHVLHREAERLIRGAASPADPPAR